MDKPYIYIYQTQFDRIVKIGESDAKDNMRLKQHIRTPHHGYFIIRILGVYEINNGTASDAENVLFEELKHISDLKDLGSEIWYADFESNPYTSLMERIDKILLQNSNNKKTYGAKKLSQYQIMQLNKEISPYFRYENENAKCKVANNYSLNRGGNSNSNILSLNKLSNSNKIWLKYKKTMYELTIIDVKGMVVEYSQDRGTLYKIAHIISNGNGINYNALLYSDSSGKQQLIHNQKSIKQ